MTLDEAWAAALAAHHAHEADVAYTPVMVAPPEAPDFFSFVSAFAADAVVARAMQAFQGGGEDYAVGYEVLLRYGPAARAAIPMLVDDVEHHKGYGVRILFAIDPEEVYSRGYHHLHKTAAAVRGVASGVGYLERMLKDAPDDVAFSGNVKRMQAHVKTLLPLLRKRLPASAPALSAARLPEDAEAILAAWPDPSLIPWLGSLEGSEVLVPRDDFQSLNRTFDLLRRRRCAGLPHAPVSYQPLLARAFANKYLGADEARAAARMILETRDPAWTPRIGELLADGRSFVWDERDPIAHALIAYPQSLPMVPESQRVRIETYRLPDWAADTYDDCAWRFWRDPGDRQAARRCAEIERATGTPITARREAWLNA